MDGRTSMRVSIHRTWCLAPLTAPSVHPHLADPAKLTRGVLPSAPVPGEPAKITENGGHREGTRAFGVLLRKHRLASSLSQEALAERARLSVATIAALERGRSQ